MSSAPRGMVVPITTTAVYSTGPVILGFIIIGILIGVLMYMYMKQHHTEYNQGSDSPPMDVSVTNNSPISYAVTLSDGKKIMIPPGKIAKLFVNGNSVIVATGYNFDGTPIMHSYNISNSKIQKLYITPSGFRTDNTGSENVQLVNNSPYPVMFVERSNKGGRRWASDIVPPYGAVGGNFVGIRTTWEIIHPTDEDDPISSITVGGKAKRLLFDGVKLTAE